MRPTVDEITAITAECFNITVADIRGNGRARRFSWPRQIAMQVCREMTDHSLDAIACSFGDRDHTTAMHAVRHVTERTAACRDAKAERDRVVREIRERVTGPEFRTRRATGPAFTTTRKETA